MSTVSALIGICEDDADLRSVLTRALADEGHAVRSTASGQQAVRRFSDTPVDGLILDVGLPDADGRDVCQALRAHGVTAPVLFLTARDALTDRLAGFHAGGDDYLTKPFAVAELLVRLDALLRRRTPEPPPAPGELRLDASAHVLRIGDRAESLTPTEYRLLAALAGRPDTVVRRRELIAAAWPDGALVHDNTLDAYLGRVRRKLRSLDASQSVVTVRGVGYALR